MAYLLQYSQNFMKKDFMIGNKIICQKLHKKQRKRQLNRLQQIKNRPNSFVPLDPPFFRQTSQPADQKIIEIERSNIVLFNRIASIIKQRPKLTFPKSREYVKSLDDAKFNQEKKQNELKLKNQLYSRRISEQQPTIKNDLIFKERIRHEGYLKLIGKYPFNPYRRTQSDFQLTHQNEEQNEMVFHKRTLDYDIKINKIPLSNEYIFTIINLADDKQHRLSMNAEKFRQELLQCKNNYEKIVGRLRMQKNGEMKYIQADSKESSPQNK